MGLVLGLVLNFWPNLKEAIGAHTVLIKACTMCVERRCMWDEGTCYQWDRAGVGWMVNDDVDC